MENLIRVAVDAMGGDYAPTEAVKGAVAAVNEKENVEVLLVGKQEVIEKELSACSYPSERIRVINASQVIETGEPPVAAIRGKKRFFYSGRHENGKAAGSRCIRICRKFRSDPGRRNHYRGQDTRR